MYSNSEVLNVQLSVANKKKCMYLLQQQLVYGTTNITQAWKRLGLLSKEEDWLFVQVQADEDNFI